MSSISSHHHGASTSFVSNASPQSQLRRVILSCMIGNALEWYDFALYGYFATIIGALFFPSTDPFASLMATFGVFAAGFIMRPIGAVFFGHVGDRMGRKKALLWSIYLMAAPTALIGCLPTYDHIGWLAPFLLTLVRLLQGFSMGGEFTGSMVFIVEHASRKGRGFAGSWASFSLLMGVFLGSAVAVLINFFLSSQDLQSWGWRLPFILSLLGSGVGSYMRRALVDPEHFSKIKADQKARSTPFVMLLRDHRKEILIVLLLDLTVSIGVYLIVTFVVSYLSAIMLFSKEEALSINMCSMTCFAAVIPFSGWLSDRVGRKPVMIVSALLLCIFVYPLFEVFSWGSFTAALWAHSVLGILMGLYFAPIPAVLSELFPLTVRYSGLSIAHNLSMAFFGGSTPLVVTALIQGTQNTSSPAFYLMFAIIFSLLGLLWMKDRFQEELDSPASF